MADQDKTETTGFKLPDPAEIGRSMADIAERSQRIVGEWLKRQADRGARARSAEHRQRVHGDDRPADGQPGQAGRRRSSASGRTT